MANFPLAGKLLMIPIPIAADSLDTIPESVKQKSIAIKYYFVENIRTVRRYLKSIDSNVVIDDIHFEEINHHQNPDLNLLKKWLKEGYEVGVMSESGCPGIADPGSLLAAKAQEWGAEVVPLTGPSSIILALMASGFSGQRFRFIGYLSVKNPQRDKEIKELEQQSLKKSETQIFIETPYRNHQLIKDLIQNCSAHTKLCVAANISSPDAYIRTMPLSEWKKFEMDIHKTPAIFLLMAN